MRLVRLAPLVLATALLAACERTGDSPGAGDTPVPYGGAANGASIGETPGYLNAAGADKNPNPGAAGPAAAPAADSTAKAPADSAAKPAVAPAPAAH
jgi:hypothetical protein